MYRIILAALVLCFASQPSFSQCDETAEPKVLLVGDSWAFFMNTDGTINTVLDKWGMSNYTYISNSTIAISGAQTDDFQKQEPQDEIRAQLLANPTIKAVHLSIGGNDFLGDWNRTMTQAQTDTLLDGVFVRLDSVIRFVESCRPGIQVFWPGYTYTNFKEVITEFAFPTAHPFYSTWHSMGDPDFIEINNLQNYVSSKMDSYCVHHPNVHFVDAAGLMQNIYGQPTAMSVPPNGTFAPGTTPMPHGDPNYPSNKVSMRDYGITKDCYHLSPEAYRHMFSYDMQKYYHKLFMDDFFALSSNNAQTGSVSSTGNVSTSLFVGESSGERFSTVLSFNTSGMADTTLRKASIFLRRQGLTGTNPVATTFEVKIKTGNFGSTADVEAADYTATADLTGDACIFGSKNTDGDWVRLDLPIAMLSQISNTGTTQFIISAPNATGGKTTFYDSSDPEFAPVLNLAYGETPSAISEANRLKDFRIYPNPTNGRLTIELENEVVKNIEVCNILGATMLQPQLQNNTIDISILPAGMYMLNVTTANGKASQRIVKE